LGYGFWVLGFGVCGLVFGVGVHGSALRVEDFGGWVESAEFGVEGPPGPPPFVSRGSCMVLWGSWSRFEASMFRVKASGFRVEGQGSRVECLGLRVMV